MSVAGFIGQCFNTGVWGLCSRKSTVNKYVEKAATRKWKYRDGKNDDEADGVVDVGDLAELEYSIVEQQPNAIVLKIDDMEPHRQESVEGPESTTYTVSEHLLRKVDDLEEEEMITSPTVMNGIENKLPRRSSSLTSEQTLATQNSVTDIEHETVESSTPKDSVGSHTGMIENVEENKEEEDTGTDQVIDQTQENDIKSDINDNVIQSNTTDDHELPVDLSTLEKLKEVNQSEHCDNNNDSLINEIPEKDIIVGNNTTNHEIDGGSDEEFSLR